MKRIIRRGIAVLMAVAMVLCMSPVPSSAAGTVYTTSQTNLGWNDGDIFVINGSTYSFNSSGESFVHYKQASNSGTSAQGTTATIATDGTITLNNAFGSSTISFPSGYNAWNLIYFREDGESHYYFTAINYNPKYTITYDTNAGTDTVTGLSGDIASVSQGSSVTLPTLSRAGYTFNGWYTASSGGTRVGAGGASYTPTGNITLYAQWTVIPATAPTISIVTGATLTYGYSSGSVSVTVSEISGHSLSYQWYDRGTTNSNSGGTAISGATSASLSIPTGKSAGAYYYYCVVKSTRTDNNQTATSTSSVATVTVNKAASTLPTVTQYSGTYDGNAHSITVSGGGGGTIKYSTDNSTWSTTNPTRKDVGETTVYVKIVGDSNHNDSNVVNSKISISKKEVGLTWSNTSFTYDSRSHLPVATATNLVSGDTCSVTVTGAQTDAGTYTATATALSNNNYKLPDSNTQSFTISKAGSSATVTAKKLTYTGTDQELVMASGVSGGSISYSTDNENWSSTIPGKKDAGTYTVYWKVTADDNHNDSSGSVSVTISKAKLTVTASGKNITYGDEPANAGVTYSGFVNNESEAVLGGALAYEYTYSQYGDKGSYKITPSGLTSDNYEIIFVQGTLTVAAKEIGLSWDSTSFTYDGEYHAPEATATGLVNGDSCNVTVTGAKKAAGSYTATASSIDNANYALPAENTKGFTIGQKVVTITANEQTITYGDSIVTGITQVTTDGIVNGDSLTAITLTPSTSDATTEGSITPSAATIQNGSEEDVTGNYSITYTDGTLTINKKQITISGITASNKVYDRTTDATLVYTEINWADCGRVGSDDLSVSATGVFADSNVGTQKKVTVSGLTLEGTKADNYKLAEEGQQTETEADISQKTITIAGIKAEDKIYDAGIEATLDCSEISWTDCGMIEGDSLTVTADGEFEDAFVGEDKTVSISNLTLGGSSANNYKLADTGHQTETSADITKKAVTITADSDEKVYDGTELTCDSYTNTDLAEGDSIEDDSVVVTGGQTEVGESENTPTEGHVLNKSGDDVTDCYDITYVNGTLKITPKAVTVTTVDSSKTFGEDDPEFEYIASGLIGEEELEGITLSRAEGEDVGEYLISASSDGEKDTNYDITINNVGKLTITAKEVSKPIVAEIVDQIFTGDEVKPEVVVKDGDDIIPSSEYMVQYLDNVEPGTAKVVIKDKDGGNYVIGEIELTFTIIEPGKIEVNEPEEADTDDIGLDYDSEDVVSKVELSEEDEEAIRHGKNVKIFIEVTDISSSVPSEDKALIEEKLQGELPDSAAVGIYLDINLFKQIEGEEKVRITETKDKISISFEIPESLRAENRTYYIVRVHDGEATVIIPTIEGNTLTFETDKFSTYALAYSDEADEIDKSYDPEKKDDSSADVNDKGDSSYDKVDTVTAKTGDSFNPQFILLIMILAIVSLSLVVVMHVKNNKE